MTGARFVDSNVLNSLNTFMTGPNNELVADTLKVMDVERDVVADGAGYRADIISKAGRVPLW